MKLRPESLAFEIEKNLVSIKLSVLVSWGLFNQVPQTKWLKIKETYFLTFLEARSSKSSCQQAHAFFEGSKKDFFFASS